MMTPKTSAQPIRIGVSSCLLGHKVRFDGQHKRNDFLCDTFGQFVEWVPVCPEVEVGLGTPRETMRLVAAGETVRLVFPKSGRDLTTEMTRFSEGRVRALEAEGLSGYVLKKDSPTCGLFRVRIYAGEERGMPATKDGRGLFAAALARRFPNLPLEEEGRLNDPLLRENFVERVFAYHRLQGFFATPWKLGDLVRFHTVHKLTLMAHSPQAYQELGRLVAGAKGRPRPALRAEYKTRFMAALAVLATKGRHANVLMHIAGYLRQGVEEADRKELSDVITDYRRGLVPLIVPITLLKHHLRRLGIPYIAEQVYLDPHPRELMLRNHV
jgi:uncharacterized protein YbgA (DUF1722 family)/uncharacterized protein YbbK (DUF523 family)